MPPSREGRSGVHEDKKDDGHSEIARNSSLELSPGLNIIEAPNEHGKSTWCGFISAMLYGVDTSERDRNGLSLGKDAFPSLGRRRYGWYHETGGRRTRYNHPALYKGHLPNEEFHSRYTGTADFIKTMTGDTAGEELTGVSRPIFERTAYIRRPDIRVNQTSDLEKRISSIVSSGEENASFTDADALMRSWQRRLKFNRSGTIPALQQKLKEAQDRLRLIESSSDEIANLRNTIGRLEKQIELMERDLEIHDKLEKRASVHRVREAKENAQRAAQKVDELRAAVTKNGHEMTREDINDIRETRRRRHSTSQRGQRRRACPVQSEKDLSDVMAKRKASPLFGHSSDEVSADISSAAALEEKIRNAKDKKPVRWLPISVTVLGILALIVTSGLLLPVRQPCPFAGRCLGRTSRVLWSLPLLPLLVSACFL